jgi:hypothetical protein
VQAVGLAQGLVAEVDPASVQITLAGTMPALNAIPPDQVIAVVDATGRGPGTYTLDVNPRVPSGVSVQSVQPARVTVTIKAR